MKEIIPINNKVLKILASAKTRTQYIRMNLVTRNSTTLIDSIKIGSTLAFSDLTKLTHELGDVGSNRYSRPRLSVF